jgi:thioredoxin-like negative regulator of GroEL
MLELDNKTITKETVTGNALLLFYTERCPLCSPIIDLLQELEQEACNSIVFAKINFDLYPEIVKEYGIFGVPIVLAIKDGTILHGWGGLSDIDAYRTIIKNYFLN